MNTTKILNKFTDGGVLSYTELRRVWMVDQKYIKEIQTEMNHNVTINFDEKTKTIQADKAIELFNNMKTALLDTRSKSYTATSQKAYIDKKLQGIDNIISGIQDGYKIVYEDNRHRTYDKPMYNNINLSKKKQYIVVCDKEDKIVNSHSSLTELESFDNYDEALELASKIAIKDYVINKK